MKKICYNNIIMGKYASKGAPDMKILYKNAYVYVENCDGRPSFVYGRLMTDGKMIARVEIGEYDETLCKVDKVIDLGGALIAPGLIDIHTHGRAGGDFNSADADMMTSDSVVHDAWAYSFLIRSPWKNKRKTDGTSMICPS
jgi:imidazolonepropionase-like amidohydrolase